MNLEEALKTLREGKTLQINPYDRDQINPNFYKVEHTKESNVPVLLEKRVDTKNFVQSEGLYFGNQYIGADVLLQNFERMVAKD